MSDPTLSAWSRENDLLFQLRQLREENERLREALAEQPAQQEPVAIALNTGTKQGVKWLKNVEHGESLYTTPPQRKPLTDEQIETIWRRVQANDFHDCVQPFARTIEAAHGIKENT